MTRARPGTAAYRDCFGYLPISERLEFAQGIIAPLPHLAEAQKWVSKYTHPDGHIYPPMVHTRRLQAGGKRPRKIARSERPSFLWKLPATHELELHDLRDAQVARSGTAGFLIHFVGLLYGWRCQFHDWWLEGRVDVTGDADYGIWHSGQASACIGQALDVWSRLDDRPRTVAINAMYMHGRTATYEAEWERFQAEYQIFDAIYAVARDSGRLPRPRRRKDHPHAARIEVACDALGLAFDSTKVKTIVRLRNELLHEALWDGGMPGDARSQESFYAALWLHKLSRRAMFGTLSLSGDYVRSPWWGLGQHDFDLGR